MGGILAFRGIFGGFKRTLCRAVHYGEFHPGTAAVGDANQIKAAVLGYNVFIGIGKPYCLGRRNGHGTGGFCGAFPIGKGDGSGTGLCSVHHGSLAVAAIADGIAHIGHTGIAARPTHGRKVLFYRTIQPHALILGKCQGGCTE